MSTEDTPAAEPKKLRVLAPNELQDSMLACVKNVTTAVETGGVRAILCVVIRDDGEPFLFQDTRAVSPFHVVGVLESVKLKYGPK
jgi:hypothetical protein